MLESLLKPLITVSSTGDWHSPPQMPPIPTLFMFFTTVYRRAGANGLFVALYLVTLDHFEEVGLKFAGCVHISLV